MKVPFLDLSLQHKAVREQVLMALAATYDASRFILGKDVEEFERNFSSTLGYPRALGMNSGTSPLHVASVCGGFGPGDEVITTPFTFISSAWGISYVGARPVFTDIEADTFNLDPAKIEAAITPRTKGIVVVHLFGQPARMDEIIAIAQRHNLFVVEDCAQAVGARYKHAPVGLVGDAGTFSFYPTKNLGGCGEGGAFVSRHDGVFEKARLLRNHGSAERYHHEMVGFNFRMDGFQGAVLNVKLPHLAAWVARRRAIAVQCREADALRFAAVFDAATQRMVSLERAFQRKLGAGCQLAFAAHATADTLYFFHEQTGPRGLPLAPGDFAVPLETAARVLKQFGFKI
jgi:dTDP-4-amino-4,6-dideoxygalactose transaminase